MSPDSRLASRSSERTFYSHLVNKTGMSHEHAVGFIHAAKHGEVHPGETLPIHSHLQMATHHLDMAIQHHAAGNIATRETHLGFAAHHLTQAHEQGESGVQFNPTKVKSAFVDLQKKSHLLDQAMRESIFQDRLDVLAEQLGNHSE